MNTIRHMILHVDDDKFTRQLVGFMFEDCDLELISVDSADTCMSALSERPVDLILLDSELGDKSGIEIAQDVFLFDKRIPIVFLSAKNEDQIFNGFRPPNVKGVLRKPFIPEQVVETIQAVLKGDKEPFHFPNQKNTVNLTQLQQEYRGHLLAQVLVLDRAWHTLASGAECLSDCDQFVGDVHKISGTAGLAGFSSVSEAAKAVEEALRCLDEHDLTLSFKHTKPLLLELFVAIERL